MELWEEQVLFVILTSYRRHSCLRKPFFLWPLRLFLILPGTWTLSLSVLPQERWCFTVFDASALLIPFLFILTVRRHFNRATLLLCKINRLMNHYLSFVYFILIYFNLLPNNWKIYTYSFFNNIISSRWIERKQIFPYRKIPCWTRRLVPTFPARLCRSRCLNIFTLEC